MSAPVGPAGAATATVADERAALDRLREYLIYGNRQDAIEWAMSRGLWGHALQLAAHADRRTRAAVAARFLAALPRADPLHTLYAALALATPPAATCVAEERWGDWRPHAAIVLANTSARPDADRATLTQLGDSLQSRGLTYCAQFCYMSAGVPLAPHPLAPLQGAVPVRARTHGSTPAPAPRLTLVLADPRAGSLAQLATNRAIFATEIYEYALSLSRDYVIPELQVYKLVLACRLVDAGAYERALAYTEQAARAVTRAPHDYSPALVRSLAELADRLKYHEPALQEDALPADGEEGEASAHQQWLRDVTALAHALSAGATSHPVPEPVPMVAAEPEPAPTGLGSHQATPVHGDGYYAQQSYSWGEQAQQYQQPAQPYPEPAEEATTADYSQYYGQQSQQVEQQAAQLEPEAQPYTYGDEWNRTEEHHAQSYADPYWQGDNSYGYGEAGAGAGAGAGAEGARPTITMPGAGSPRAPLYGDYDEDRPKSADRAIRDTDSPKADKKQEGKTKEGGAGGKGAGAGAGRGGGWLGGILTKLSLRPPNQMILPDDKNPSIVWDAENKRWRNLEGDADEPAAPPPPPCPPAHLTHPLPNASPPLAGAAPPASPAAPVSNIFKMQKGRHIKKSYVDVFNPSGAATRERPPVAEVLGAAAPLAPAPAYFVPVPAPPHHQGGVYDPSQFAADGDDYRTGI